MTDDEMWADIEERRQVTLARRQGGNFVTPYGPGEQPKPIVRRVDPLPMQIDAPLPVVTVQKLATSHVDRAKGFSIVSIPMAAGVGIGGLLIAVGMGAVPLFSMGALLVLFLSFLGVWLVAYLWHQSASPDGVVLWQVLLHYRLLSREQKARLARMEGDE